MAIADRLRRMKEFWAAPGAPSRGSEDNRAAGDELPGWERAGDFTFMRVSEEPGLLGRHFTSLLTSIDHVESSRLCFMDTETTGLSTGAGAMVFLFGIGVSDDDRLSIRQIFLSDFPGESEFLRLVQDSLPADPIYVTYNGSTFDLPLLKSRFAMNRREFHVPLQLDLLHVARRFWQRRIGPCGLSDVERAILGVHRVGDVSGAEVPELYFEYLRSGDSNLLAPLFEHHRRDVSSLQRLFVHCEEQLADPLRAEIDHARVGRWLLRRGDASGLDLLDHAFGNGDSLAGLELAAALRRSGDRLAAVQIWRQMWQSDRNVAAGVELAKHLEHRDGNFTRALQLVETMLHDPGIAMASPGREYARQALAQRRDRLLRRRGIDRNTRIAHDRK